MIDKTSILLEKETRQRLMEIGNKGDTYDDIVKKLIKRWKDE